MTYDPARTAELVAMIRQPHFCADLDEVAGQLESAAKEIERLTKQRHEDYSEIEELHAVLGEPNQPVSLWVKELRAECDALRAEVTELEHQNDELRKPAAEAVMPVFRWALERDQIIAERDALRADVSRLEKENNRLHGNVQSLSKAAMASCDGEGKLRTRLEVVEPVFACVGAWREQMRKKVGPHNIKDEAANDERVCQELMCAYDAALANPHAPGARVTVEVGK